MTLMGDLHGKRVRGEIQDTLLLLQHHPVISKGRRLQGQSIPNEKKIREQGIEIQETDRGGLLTYHGPGQIVFYFIFEVNRYFDGVSMMVHGIEDVVLAYLKGLNVEAGLKEDHPGIWVGSDKIGSVGFRVTDGVTKHGLSLNVDSDLGVYNLFDPCGLSGACMSSVAKCLKRSIPVSEVEKMGEDLAGTFHQAFTRWRDLKISKTKVA